ncbi:ribosome biogenesis GTPase Der [Buchnera aphidicola]|uniref:ribosome biogenesis GTPase Der n=1 Tax=Buchnera aphidicola TaxID=9 RepID=UPI00313AA968
MYPKIVLIGRSNVGKSSFFNMLTKKKIMLVHKLKGTTYDRNFENFYFQDKKFILMDTAGFELSFFTKKLKKNSLFVQIYTQIIESIKESDLVIFMVDANISSSNLDFLILKKIQKNFKKIFLCINKIDLIKDFFIDNNFYKFGIKNIYPISILHRIGILDLLKSIYYFFYIKQKKKFECFNNISKKKKISIKIGVIGKSNVGKSTLINSLINEKRVITHEIAGTTRDLIKIPFTDHKNSYFLIDTRGFQRKKTQKNFIDSISRIKTINFLSECHVVLIIFDAYLGVTSHDLSLLNLIIKKGCAFIIVINKWDLISQNKKFFLKKNIFLRLKFIKCYKIFFVSALKKIGIQNFFNEIKKVYKNSIQIFTPLFLTKILQKAILYHPTHMGTNHKLIRLKYAHLGGTNPLKIIIHGTQTQFLKISYQKYLKNFFQKKLNIFSSPIVLFFKNSINPYIKK